MQLPLPLAPGSSQYPTENRCAVCGRASLGDATGFVRLGVGALVDADALRPPHAYSEVMQVVFDFWYHGPVNEVGDNAEATVAVVTGAAGAQLDILMCSAICVREFLMTVASAVEGRIADAATEFSQAKAARRSVPSDSSRLGAAKGRVVLQVHHVPHGMQFVLGGDAVLIIYSPCFVSGPAGRSRENLVGVRLLDVDEMADRVVLRFEDSSVIGVDLRDRNAYRGPGALVLKVAGHPDVVWTL